MILDTMAFIRLLREELEDELMTDLEAADALVVSAASIFEINQKIRIGKLAMRSLSEREIAAFRAQGLTLAALTPEIMARAASMTWRRGGADHRDPFDRMIAATALGLDAPVVSSDAAFATLLQAGLRLRAL